MSTLEVIIISTSNRGVNYIDAYESYKDLLYLERTTSRRESVVMT